jgi:hypothetical protein
MKNSCKFVLKSIITIHIKNFMGLDQPSRKDVLLASGWKMSILINPFEINTSITADR